MILKYWGTANFEFKGRFVYLFMTYIVYYFAFCPTKYKSRYLVQNDEKGTNWDKWNTIDSIIEKKLKMIMNLIDSNINKERFVKEYVGCSMKHLCNNRQRAKSHLTENMIVVAGNRWLLSSTLFCFCRKSLFFLKSISTKDYWDESFLKRVI